MPQLMGLAGKVGCRLPSPAIQLQNLNRHQGGDAGSPRLLRKTIESLVVTNLVLDLIEQGPGVRTSGDDSELVWFADDEHQTHQGHQCFEE